MRIDNVLPLIIDMVKHFRDRDPLEHCFVSSLLEGELSNEHDTVISKWQKLRKT